MRLAVLAALTLAILSTVSRAEEKKRMMDCVGDPPFNELTCSFYSVGISEAEAPSNLDSEVTKAMDAIKKDGREAANLCKDMLSADTRERMQRRKSEPAGRHQLAVEQWRRIVDFCGCTDDECRRTAWRKVVAGTFEGVCKIRQFVSNEQVFKRTGKRTWMATLTNDMCNVVTVMVLEHEPHSTILWTLTQTRTGKPDADNPLCSWQEMNVPSVYSWKYDADTLIQCRAVTF